MANIQSFVQGIAQASTLAESDMNVMRIFNVQFRELSHNSFLAWLLNPYESHGLGPKFLKSVLKLTSLDASQYDLDTCEVITEEPAGPRRADIVVRGEDFILVIENKVLSSELENQTADLYRHYSELSNREGKEFNGIFLSPAGKRAEEEGFISIGHRKIIDVIEEMHETSQIDSEVGKILKDYVQNMEVRVMKTQFGGLSEATRVYIESKRKWGKIESKHRSDMKNLLNAVAEEMESRWSDSGWKVRIGGISWVQLFRDNWKNDDFKGLHYEFLVTDETLLERGAYVTLHAEPSLGDSRDELLNEFKRLASGKLEEFIDFEKDKDDVSVLTKFVLLEDEDPIKRAVDEFERLLELSEYLDAALASVQK